MEHTNTTTTTRTPRTSVRRRVAALAVGLAAGAIVVGTVGAGRSAAGPSAQRICTWRPAADPAHVGAQVGPTLLGTVRLQDGRAEVLHHVTCSDGVSRDAWMAAID